VNRGRVASPDYGWGVPVNTRWSGVNGGRVARHDKGGGGTCEHEVVGCE